MKARRCSRLPVSIQKRLLEHFVAATPARNAAELVGVDRKTATLYYRKLREIIAEQIAHKMPVSGGIEVDESYCGGHRKGKQGRGAAGKVAVFGLLKRHGRVHAVMIPNAGHQTLMSIIRKKVQPDSIVYSDSWHAYDKLDVSEFHHERIAHSRHPALGGNDINGIENFWSQAKRHLRRYNGIPRKDFHLFLTGCEWRFNIRSPAEFLKILTQWAKLPM
ncbi:IS1595 family transposase [Novacetimonas pomaceti]|uniref:IS1595 family transposase n=1 Tax=Novacetimonas pomaceti TaxID=2021998 RepID=A0A318QUG5_9PROT|nr:IS1595 family transposase [Novacetimonas pomaceti]PYD76373.1 IS1595 family transposase [Novacetimonas pomaceti]